MKRRFKKIVFIVSLVLLNAVPVYAVNIFDHILYKEVVLTTNHVSVLVNRLTGEVKYIRLNNGRWTQVKGALQHQCQLMYDHQAKR